MTVSIKGKTMGGQKPIANSTYYVYQVGTSGYGSTGKLVGSATGDATGNFEIDTLNCDSPSSSLYILSVGGDAGFGTNTAIVEGAALGTCSAANNEVVNISEITTAALAYGFARFFSNTSSDGNTSDHFGQPASLKALDVAGTYTIPTIVNLFTGQPNTSTSTVTLESDKLLSLGNLLGSCVNTGSPASTGCSSLFAATSGSSVGTPSNTLEAAVAIALQPYRNVNTLYSLIPANSAFGGGLTVSPNDWSIAIAYQSPTLGLGLDNKTISTIDVDASGRVWFPSTIGGARGVANFDPTTGAFTAALNSGLTHPEQVAIDAEGNLWANDTQSGNLVGFNTGTLAAQIFSLPNTVSTAVTPNIDGGVTVGLINNANGGVPGLSTLKYDGTAYNYTQTSLYIPGSNGLLVTGLAGDVNDGVALGATNTTSPGFYNLYADANFNPSVVNNGAGEDITGAVFTGSNYLTAQAGYTQNNDAVCVFDQRTCYPFSNPGYYRPYGLAIDGAGTLWMALSNAGAVSAVFPNGTSEPFVTGGSIASTLYLHDSTHGGTMTTPSGIAIDNAGNVWTSNAGCLGTGCTPGAFVLSQVLSAGAPTITPLVNQLSGNLVGTQPGVATPLKTSK